MSEVSATRPKAFVLYSWSVVVYILGVILWGAYVRATGSGAGCGNHWPLCNGEVIPRTSEIEAMVEFIHRATSGLGFLLVLVLFIWTFRCQDKRSPVRLCASLGMLFMVTEALLGAGLVLFGLVAEDDSLARAWVMALHLVNTHLLLAALTLTAWWASFRTVIRLRAQNPLNWLLPVLLGVLILLGASGAVAALGDTLFPSQTLSEALRADFHPTTHLLVRLRVYHPLLALLTFPLLVTAGLYAVRVRPQEDTRRLAVLAGFLYVMQLAVGLFNLLLLAPVRLQLVHLFMADLTWIAVVLLVASTLVPGKAGER